MFKVNYHINIPTRFSCNITVYKYNSTILQFFNSTCCFRNTCECYWISNQSMNSKRGNVVISWLCTVVSVVVNALTQLFSRLFQYYYSITFSDDKPLSVCHNLSDSDDDMLLVMKYALQVYLFKYALIISNN